MFGFVGVDGLGGVDRGGKVVEDGLMVGVDWGEMRVGWFFDCAGFRA